MSNDNYMRIYFKSNNGYCFYFNFFATHAIGKYHSDITLGHIHSCNAFRPDCEYQLLTITAWTCKMGYFMGIIICWRLKLLSMFVL